MTPAEKPQSDSTNKGAEPQTQAASAATKPEPPAPRPRRRRRLAIFSILILVILVIAIVYFFRLDIPFRWTDDAYVHGNKVFLVARETGTVTAINADDTDLVREGQPVVVLDDDDQRVALLQAEGALGDTMRKVCQFYLNVAELKANVDAEKVELDKAEDDYHRRITSLPGTVSSEDIIHARQARDTARALLIVAEQELGAAQALTANIDLEHHPLVLQAEANVLNADLDLQRTIVRAPATGYVMQRTVEVGQRVTIGTDLLAIIPLDQIWVNANFKEGELRFVRIGQPVTLRSDFYGDSAKYKGHVVGLAPTTGAAFSLLPPDEGSGNWIKIIQRVPVRIILDDDDALEKHPLRIGLSMRVTVDTSDHRGAMLAQVPSEQPMYATDIYSNEWAQANELLRSLVATNLQALAKLTTNAAATTMPEYDKSEIIHE
ncbi:MAG TPA: HlyD family efflux transporter periplasmic adaptor subunit [Candidatus Sulfotelmatobacter sp.]|nr:HlyD family efflux transporter periplasmic adaptor subunit [Candidatus Sulfotelmatobacter sp.]